MVDVTQCSDFKSEAIKMIIYHNTGQSVLDVSSLTLKLKLKLKSGENFEANHVEKKPPNCLDET